MNQEKLMALQEEEMEIDLLELFSYYLSKLHIIVICLLIGATFAGSFTYFAITPLYKATSKIYMVSASSDSVINLSDLNLGTSLSQDYEELMRIRPIAEEVIDNLKLEYTVKELEEMISISTIADTRIIAVSVIHEDPQMAADICNEFAEISVDYLPDVMETSKPNIAEDAIVPEEKDSPSLTKNTLIGAILGMLACMGLYTVLFLLDDTLKTSEDVEKAFGLVPLTVIPEGKIEGQKEEAGKAKKEKKLKRKK